MALIAVVGGSAVSWLLLLLARVRPAGGVTLLGFVVNLVLQTIVYQVVPGGPTVSLLVAGCAIGFGTAALIVRPGGRRFGSRPHS
ncbi:hypothetical protein [Planotetraspora phitsanulokensis]|nr:hypothetical protein [Planotetraspora phitsanulokensis]